MKCKKCGVELVEGVLFCRECGAKVEKTIRFCRECASELADGVKFCSNCGAKVNFMEDIEAEASTLKVSMTEDGPAAVTPVNTGEYSETLHTSAESQSTGEKIKERALNKWNSFDLFCKIIIVGMGVTILMLLIALFSHKGLPIFVSVLQIGGLVVATLMHKDLIKNPKSWLKYLVLAVAILFTVLNIMSYSAGKSKPTTTLATKKPTQTTQVPQQTTEPSQKEETEATKAFETEKPVVETSYTIAKGAQYAFMSDEWNVYIATAISDSIIKIEHWDKTLKTTKKMSLSEALGSYKIKNPENGFAWLDDEHTAFTFIFKDKNNSCVKNAASHIFTININESDVNKGTNYDKNIACYSYTNDDWHMYRAIPLTESLIKIECWARGMSIGDHLFGWDWCVIDVNNTDTDFAWTDEEHTSFTITTKDPENSSYWERDTFVIFELENEEYKYPNVISYLGLQTVGDDDAKVPDSASSYKYDDDKDVQNSLTEASFTNIKTEILYDII